MKFGMPTLVECRDIYECHRVALSSGLDFIEINMSFPQYQPRSLDVEKLKKLCDADGLFYTIHADEMLNPFDFNDNVSHCYFEVMRDTIRFAKQLSVPVINMHLLKGVYVTLPNKVVLLNDVYFEKYMEKVGQFIKMCEQEIGETDLKIAIENVDSNPFTSSQLAAIELFLASPVFSLTLDTGHELCLDFADTEVFKKHPRHMLHMHLHDAKGKSAHLPFGEGDVDIQGKLEAFKDGDTCLIEVKTVDGLRGSIEYLKKHNLWKQEDSI